MCKRPTLNTELRRFSTRNCLILSSVSTLLTQGPDKKRSKIWDHLVSDPCRDFRSPQRRDDSLANSIYRWASLQNSAEQKSDTEKPNHMDGEVNESLWTQTWWPWWISTTSKTEFFHEIFETWDTPKYRNSSDQTCAREERQREEEKQEAEWMTEKLMNQVRSYKLCWLIVQERRRRKEEEKRRKREEKAGHPRFWV